MAITWEVSIKHGTSRWVISALLFASWGLVCCSCVGLLHALRTRCCSGSRFIPATTANALSVHLIFCAGGGTWIRSNAGGGVLGGKAQASQDFKIHIVTPLSPNVQLPESLESLKSTDDQRAQIATRSGSIFSFEPSGSGTTTRTARRCCV